MLPSLSFLKFIDFILYASYKLPKVSDSYAKLLGQEVDGGEGMGRRRKFRQINRSGQRTHVKEKVITKLKAV